MVSAQIKLGKQFKNLSLVNRVAAEEFGRAMSQTVGFLETQVKNITPVGVTGLLRSGVKGTVISPLLGRVAEVGPAARYVEVVELGRRAGRKFPPPDAIELWIKRTDKGQAFLRSVKEKYNIKSDRTALKSATFLKSRGISKRGIKAVKMFKKTERKFKRKSIAFFERAVLRIERRLSD